MSLRRSPETALDREPRPSSAAVHGSASLACMAQVVRRDIGVAALLACNTGSELPCPVSRPATGRPPRPNVYQSNSDASEAPHPLRRGMLGSSERFHRAQARLVGQYRLAVRPPKNKPLTNQLSLHAFGPAGPYTVPRRKRSLMRPSTPLHLRSRASSAAASVSLRRRT